LKTGLHGLANRNACLESSALTLEDGSPWVS
jgi:hypothetical protein